MKREQPTYTHTDELGVRWRWVGGKPVLWETMFFCPDGEDQMRCSGSREQAEAMHHEMVKRVKAKQKVKR